MTSGPSPYQPPSPYEQQPGTYQQPSYYQQPGTYEQAGAYQPGTPYPLSPYQQQPGYPPVPRSTNTMAILSIVFAFVFAPLAIVFGVVGRRQIRVTGEDGDGLALAGIIIGSIFTGFFVLYILFIVVMIGMATTGV